MITPTARRHSAMVNIKAALEQLRVAEQHLRGIHASETAKHHADKVARAIEAVRAIGDIS